MSDTDDLVAALAPVTAAYRQLGVGHYVGGSIASTFHGAIRSTFDVVCDLRTDQAETQHVAGLCLVLVAVGRELQLDE